MARKTITLQITAPDGATSVAQSELESVILGSGPGSAITIADPLVSNVHCMLKLERSGRVTVIDLGSEHGTRVGAQAVTAPVVLASGATLQLGRTRVRVLFGEGPRATAAETPMARAEARREAGIEAPVPEGERAVEVDLFWGATLLDSKQFQVGRVVHTQTFGVGSPTAPLVLARVHSAGATVQVPAGARVVVGSSGGGARKGHQALRAQGRLTPGQGAEVLELAPQERAEISQDELTFVVRVVRRAVPVTLNTLTEHDFTFFKINSICLLALVAMATAFELTPNAGGTDADELFANKAKYVKLVVTPQKRIELPKFSELTRAKEAKRNQDKETRQAKEDVARSKGESSRRSLGEPGRQKERKVNALMAGMFGGGSSSSVFSGGGLGTPINNALGNLQGSGGLGDSQGIGGLGSRGSGSGGNGTGLGLGGAGTGGRGVGGYGSLELGGRAKEATRVIPGKTTVVGGLDKDVIMKVIRRHQSEIKFCYEQELQKNPSLGGKVAVVWTIDPSGSVTDATVTESSIGNGAVEACILARIKRWRFPEPQGGGVVTVTFPWIFKAAGEGGE